MFDFDLNFDVDLFLIPYFFFIFSRGVNSILGFGCDSYDSVSHVCTRYACDTYVCSSRFFLFARGTYQVPGTRYDFFHPLQSMLSHSSSMCVLRMSVFYFLVLIVFSLPGGNISSPEIFEPALWPLTALWRIRWRSCAAHCRMAREIII